MSKKSLATFVGNCNQPPNENNLYKQFKLLLELHFYTGRHLVVLFIFIFFKKCIEKVLTPILKLDFGFRNSGLGRTL